MSILCNDCNSEFTEEAEWYLHNIETHMDMKSKCLLCDKKFLDIYRHIRTSHVREYEEYNNCPKGTGRVLYENSNATCQICGQKTKNKQLLVKHVKNLHCEPTRECDICKETVKTTNFYDHKKLHEKKLPKIKRDEADKDAPLKCEPNKDEISSDLLQSKLNLKCNVADCQKISTSKGGAIVHEWIDHEKRPISCMICDKSFKARDNLIRHVNEVHYPEMVQCPKCLNKYNKREYRGNHQYICVVGDP